MKASTKWSVSIWYITYNTFEAFEQPEKIISIRIDKVSGKRTNKTDSSSRFEYFIEGTEPQEWVDNVNVEEILESSDDNADEELF